jgi:hypothetical protein
MGGKFLLKIKGGRIPPKNLREEKFLLKTREEKFLLKTRRNVRNED